MYANRWDADVRGRTVALPTANGRGWESLAAARCGETLYGAWRERIRAPCQRETVGCGLDGCIVVRPNARRNVREFFVLCFGRRNVDAGQPYPNLTNTTSTSTNQLCPNKCQQHQSQIALEQMQEKMA